MRSSAMSRSFPLVLVLTLAASLLAGVAATPAAEAAPLGTACQTTGTWTQGELDIWFLDVEQGDAQFIVGPGGETMLLDLGENVWNRTSNTNAQMVAQTIRDICDVQSGPVHLDYVVASHLHLDHIGYAGNPHDTTAYGNGIYELLDPGQLGFTVGELVTRDAGYWQDSNGDGDCEVGTNASPSPDVVYTNAGTMSSTGRRWICWLYGPSGQADRANIDGRVTTLTNGQPWPSFAMGTGVTAEVLQANAKGIMQADGTTPVSGDHVNDPTPPSENDYSVAIKFTYGDFEYATAGDADGEYATSSFGYSYNDIETPLGPLFGNVETMRVNHHGSSHSTNTSYVADLAAETAVIQCGNNSYGHPAANVLTNLQQTVTDDGVGSDFYMTNNPCDPNVGTVAGAFNSNGDIHLVTTTAGAGYELRYDTGTNSYVARDDASEIGGGSGGGGGSDVTDLVINEFVADPDTTFANEWVELFNPTGSDIDASGLQIDDIANGGGSPKALPGGAIVPAGGHYVYDISGGFLNNGGDDVRLLTADGSTVIDSTSYSSSTNDLSWFRDGDGGAWCTADGTATQGAANTACDGSPAGGGGSGGVTDLVINEFVADPDTTFANEWVELFNPTGSDIDASGLQIDDIANGGGSPKALPGGAIVPAGGHYVYDISGGFLNNGGDDVRLLTADGSTVIDSTSYSSSTNDLSWFRDGDGGAWCTADGTATQGAANTACDGSPAGGSGTVDDLLINEYVPDHNTFSNEWVELYNPTGSDIDASGLQIDDIAGGGGNAQVIPNDTVIPAGGFYVFQISGYLLNNSGDDVRLLSADGSTVIDSHSYGSSADDQSWRRAGDGGAWCGSYGTATQGATNPSTC